MPLYSTGNIGAVVSKTVTLEGAAGRQVVVRGIVTGWEATTSVAGRPGLNRCTVSAGTARTPDKESTRSPAASSTSRTAPTTADSGVSWKFGCNSGYFWSRWRPSRFYAGIALFDTEAFNVSLTNTATCTTYLYFDEDAFPKETIRRGRRPRYGSQWHFFNSHHVSNPASLSQGVRNFNNWHSPAPDRYRRGSGILRPDQNVLPLLLSGGTAVDAGTVDATASLTSAEKLIDQGNVDATASLLPIETISEAGTVTGTASMTDSDGPKETGAVDAIASMTETDGPKDTANLDATASMTDVETINDSGIVNGVSTIIAGDAIAESGTVSATGSFTFANAIADQNGIEAWYAYDTAARVVPAGGWGNADFGGPWNIVVGNGAAGTAGELSVDGTSLIAQSPTHRAPWVILTNSVVGPDVDLYAIIALSLLPTGSTVSLGPLLRYVDVSNHYQFKVQFTTGALVQSNIVKVVAGVTTTLSAAATRVSGYTGTTLLKIHCRIVGNVLSMSIWLASAAEPANFQAVATDAGSSFSAAGPLVWRHDFTGLTNNPAATLADLRSYAPVGTTMPISTHLLTGEAIIEPGTIDATASMTASESTSGSGSTDAGTVDGVASFTSAETIIEAATLSASGSMTLAEARGDSGTVSGSATVVLGEALSESGAVTGTGSAIGGDAIAEAGTVTATASLTLTERISESGTVTSTASFVDAETILEAASVTGTASMTDSETISEAGTVDAVVSVVGSQPGSDSGNLDASASFTASEVIAEAATLTATVSFTFAGTIGETATVTATGSMLITGEAISEASTFAVSTYAYDSFLRNVVNGWGTADIGGDWTVIGTQGTPGPASDYSVANGKAIIVSPGASQDVIRLAGLSLADFDAYGAVSMSAVPTFAAPPNAASFDVQARDDGTGQNLYKFHIAFRSTGVVDITTTKTVAGGVTVLAGATQVVASYTPGSRILFHSRIVGTKLMFNAWVAGTPEPTVWMHSVTDAALSAAQAPQLRIDFRFVTNNPTFQLDSFSLVSAGVPAPIATMAAAEQIRETGTVDAVASMTAGAPLTDAGSGGGTASFTAGEILVETGTVTALGAATAAEKIQDAGAVDATVSVTFASFVNPAIDSGVLNASASMNAGEKIMESGAVTAVASMTAIGFETTGIFLTPVSTLFRLPFPASSVHTLPQPSADVARAAAPASSVEIEQQAESDLHTSADPASTVRRI